MDHRFLTLRIVFASIICFYLFAEGIARPESQKNQPSKIPSYLKICSRSDPQLNECIKESIEQLRPKLAKGIPEMGIPSCDPFVIPELSFKEGSSSVSVKSHYKDVTVRGASQFDLRRVNMDFDNDRLEFDLVLPSISTASNYLVEGKILLLPITGSGKSYGNYSNISASATVQSEKVERNGMLYYNVRDFDIVFNVGHASVRMDNLFGGNKVAGDAMNAFLNENWQLLYAEMKPILEKTVASVFKDICNKIFERFPVNDLFRP